MKILKIVLWNITAIILITVFVEFAVRLVTGDRINYQGTSGNMYQSNRYFDSPGWQPNSSGTSFGTNIKINSLGLRGDDIKLNPHSKKLLLIGDSVLFGVGVPDSLILNRYIEKKINNDSLQILNTGVIGHGLYDYQNVIKCWINEINVNKVIIFYVLNDLYRLADDTNNSITGGRNKLIENIFSFLRSNSKFYLWIKNGILDRGKSYFLYDYNLYSETEGNLQKAKNIFESIAHLTDANNIELTVFILPYHYQYLNIVKDSWKPQRLLIDFFKDSEINAFDLKPAFEKNNIDDYYLYGDAMHLSGKGHRELAKYIINNFPHIF